MSNELQKDEFYLKGNIGTVLVNGQEREISKVEIIKDATTITIAEVVRKYLESKSATEDADFEIIEPKQLPER